MDDVIKIIIGNGGLSVNSGVSFFNVVNCTLYNEGYIQVISDTPSFVGSVEHALLGAIAHFANKNLK
ncbi:hypothetical protein [Brucella pseudogrignonensis]|uniref:hypothetical protein n=1 Tax=Brucella pseudogrignonensis TaxID=419475 RepID=UPI0038D255C1